MKNKIQLISITLLNSKYKAFFNFLFLPMIFYISNYNFVENMENCCSSTAAIKSEFPTITVREAYTLEALQAETI